MRTRERTSEVIIASCDAYRITLYFGPDKMGFDKDTVIVEAPSMIGDQRIYVEVLANSQGDGNLVRFPSIHSSREITLTLWLLEQHQEAIHRALTK